MPHHSDAPSDGAVSGRTEPRTVALDLTLIAVGGAAGACARYGVDLALPHSTGDFAVATLVANLTGCFLIGILMVALATAQTRWVRPLLGVGVLGGFTTFSTHIVDALGMVSAGAAVGALAYLGATLLGGLLAVWGGVALTEFALGRRGR